MKVRDKHSIVFLIFLIYLLAQYHLVYLYYDDFGYCSLSYGYNAGIIGNAITPSGLITWLFHSYFEVNGRIFTNLAFVLVAWLGDVNLMRIFFPLCITGIYWFIYFETFSRLESGCNKLIGAAILVLSYGLFDIRVCKDGLYWFAAAFGYIVPVLLFLLFIKINRTNSVFQYLIIFLICLSCEQMVAMTFSFLGTKTILSLLEKRKLDRKDVIGFMISIVGGMVMILSPASRNRINNPGNIAFRELNFLDKLLTNVNHIIRLLFNGTGILFVTFLFVLFIITALFILKMEFNKPLKIANAGYIMISVLIWFCFVKGVLNFSSQMTCYGLFFYFVIGFVDILVLYNKLCREMITLIIAGMASIGLLLVVPEIPVRTFIPFIFITIWLMMDLISRVMRQHMGMMGYTIAGIPYAIVMITNMMLIYQGYLANTEVLKYNDAMLEEAKVLLQNGMEITEVELYRLKDDMYAGAQVYHDSVSYMKFWMDEYYQLPYEITYVYYDYGTRNNQERFMLLGE